ncbi:MAG: heavy metal translocating P-type ATPase [Clostridia bacterium]|nr:heavy metal translocating P-type ATPase [Clostridia bacterium]
MKKQFSITGMTCAACSSGIERTVKKIDGVTACSVSLMGASMTAEFDPEKVTAEQIISAVKALGYGAYDYGKQPQNNKQKGLTFPLRFFLSLALLIVEMYFSMGHMISDKIVPHGWWNIAPQIVLTLAILGLNYQYFISGVRSAVKLVPNMDTLVTLGAGVSFIYSVVVAALDSTTHALFFESAAMIVTLVTLGKWLEDKSKKRTGREIEKLLSLAPDTVRVERNGEEVSVPLSEVAEGDIIIVKQGESIAADGEIIEGHGYVDEAAITGESLPVELDAGQKAVSASVLKSGYLKIKAEKVGEDTMLAGIIRMVREAGASKAPIQKLADKVAAWFVPIVLALAIITLAVWLIVTHEVYTAFNYAVSVIVISCPCALGLATPVAVMAASGRGAGMGVLFKNAEAIQRAANIRTALLDKTATLTEGKPRVVFYESYIGDEVKEIAYAIESKLNHPLADCIASYCGEGSAEAEVEYLTGMGAHGVISGEEYYLGNDRLMQYIGITVDEEAFTRLSKEGKTVLFLADKEKPLALFALADTLKEGSKEAVKELSALCEKVVMITGDNRACAEHIAEEAGIKKDCVYAEVLPEDKLRVVREHGRGACMIGDGINDAPALKEADVGFAMGNGTDVAIESADAVLVQGDLKAAGRALRLARKTMRIIKENLFWAFFYNCVGIPVAAGCFAVLGLALNPMIAAACMSLSSLFVVCNALRLTAFEKRKNKNNILEDHMKVTLKIEGMMCGHCEKHVKDALEKIEGVVSAEANHKKKCAVVALEKEVASDLLVAAVKEAGYEVKEIK